MSDVEMSRAHFPSSAFTTKILIARVATDDFMRACMWFKKLGRKRYSMHEFIKDNWDNFYFIENDWG